jgi:hypothetical protein
MRTIEVAARKSPVASCVIQLGLLTKHNAQEGFDVMEEMDHSEARSLAMAILALTEGDRAVAFESAAIAELKERLRNQAETIQKYQTNPEA